MISSRVLQATFRKSTASTSASYVGRAVSWVMVNTGVGCMDCTTAHVATRGRLGTLGLESLSSAGCVVHIRWARASKKIGHITRNHATVGGVGYR